MKIKISKSDILKTKTHPFIEKIEQLNLLKPGSYINKDQVEYILQYKYTKDDWNFLGRYLTLKTQIEAKGFFITQSDIEPPAFRILKTEEMAEHATKKLSKALCSNYKVSYILANHDSSKLEGSSKKLYDGVKTKAATIAMAQQKILLDDFYFD